MSEMAHNMTYANQEGEGEALPRPQKCRRVCVLPESEGFEPVGVKNLYEKHVLSMSIDEYEAMRLIDLEGLTQEQCAAQMGVARTTVTNIYDSVRRKIADAIVNQKRLNIKGGNYSICDGESRNCGEHSCHRNRCCTEAVDKQQSILKMTFKGERVMRIAVTYENGQIFQHFGHTERFKVFDVENNKVVTETTVNTNGSGHGALADILQKIKADTLICGGIGGGAKKALAEAGITLYGGVSGSADEAVKELLDGKLVFDSAAECDHHGHEHYSEDHDCGSNGCGNH